MTTHTAELATTAGDAQTIVDTATRATAPTPLDEERFFSVVVPEGGHLEVIDLEKHLDAFRDRPRRKTGAYTVHDADSFVTYLDKHALPETEVWADTTRATITAVINAHTESDDPGPGSAGWQDHRATYTVRHTDAWNAWRAHDGKLLDQNTFAEHIEDRSVDIVRPTAADMLELAQTFQATIGVSFESSKLLSSGQRQLEYKETVESRAGRRGQLEIPRDFDLALVPFEGAEAYKVTARFRYRITDGQLRIGYRLERPDDVVRGAFLDVVEDIRNQVEAPVFRGSTA